jgi:C4-dicarboxylate transporter, DctM subunit
VMTLPVALPIVTAAGFDPVWFGIFIVLVVEMAQIHPPVGFNLFIIQGITNESLGFITRATFPYLLIMILFTLAMAAFPQVVLWLPNNM